MAENIWFSSDLHLNHENILTFESGVPGRAGVRPEFSNVEEMNEVLIERHNQYVKPGDKWYCLGDLGWKESLLDEQLKRMNGKKRLLLGNHDCYKMSFYMKHFQKIGLERRMEGLLFCHRPAFMAEHEAHIKGNVHGHIHERNIDDKRYLNLSVEQTNYAPVNLDTILAHFKGIGLL